MTARTVAALAAAMMEMAACGPHAADDGATPPLTSDEAANPTHQEAPRQRRLVDYGPTARRVTVIVLPGDATVEVDGVPTRRRDGVIELIGKLGETRHLRVLREPLHLEQDVIIQATGASPPRLDLVVAR